MGTNTRTEQTLPGGSLSKPPARKRAHSSQPPWWQDWKKLAACGVPAIGLLVVAVLLLRLAPPAPEKPDGGKEKAAAAQAATQPEPARLVLRWPPSERTNAQLQIDGRVHDPAELVDPNVQDQLSITLKPGAHRVWIARRGFEPFEQTVRLNAGEQETVTPVWRSMAQVALTQEPQADRQRPPAGPPADVKLPRNTWVDMLAPVKVERDAVRGQWTRNKDGLSVAPLPNARIMLPGVVEGSYDLEVEFTRHTGRNSVLVGLPVQDRFAWLALYIDYLNLYVSAVCLVDGKAGEHVDNPTRREHRETLQNSRRYRIDASVRTAGETVTIEASLDQQPMVSWSGRSKSLSVHEFQRLPETHRLGLGAYDNHVTFHTTMLRLLDDTPSPEPRETPKPLAPVASAPASPGAPASSSAAVPALAAALAELDRLLAQREPLEVKYSKAMEPVDALVEPWDFVAGAAALKKVGFDEPELAARLARRREEINRVAVLTTRMIQQIKAAQAPLTKHDLGLRGKRGCFPLLIWGGPQTGPANIVSVSAEEVVLERLVVVNVEPTIRTPTCIAIKSRLLEIRLCMLVAPNGSLMVDYISSLPVKIKQFARAVRSHWGIENTCHWCSDSRWLKNAGNYHASSASVS